LIAAVTGSVLASGPIATGVAAVAAAALGWTGWRRFRLQPLFKAAVAVEAVAGFALVVPGGPIAAAAVLFAVVVLQSQTEPTKRALVGAAASVVALGGGIAVGGQFS